MKKITFVTGAMGRGGAERVISLLANRYCQMGWEVSILLLLHAQVEYPLDERVQVVNLSDDSRKALLEVPRLIRGVRRYVREHRPDVVVAFMARICLVTDLACHGLPTRLVLSERNDPVAAHHHPIVERLLNRAYARSSLTVLQTRRVRDYFPEKVRRNSVIIPNPVGVEAVAASQRRCRIVTAGRLKKQKNQAMLIRAFAALHERYPEYTLDIFGEGELRETLQAQIDALGLRDCVKLPGNVPDVHRQMADAEMFVLPSDFEGLSNALLEAMMMGLPCIATGCLGCDEVIEDGVNGVLIPVGDEKALADALLRLVEDKAAARAMGERAASTAAAFRVDCVMDMWREAIEGASEA